MRKSGALLVLTLLTLCAAQPGLGATIQVCADSVCATGTASALAATVGQQIVFTVGLDAQTDSYGYELFFSYDPTEIALSHPVYDKNEPDSAHQLYADAVLAPDTLPFTVAPAPCADPSNCRASVLSLAGYASTALFDITFDVIGVASDGEADFSVFAGGLGGDPAPPLIGFPAAIDVVPEPATALLLGAGIVGLALHAQRRRRS